MAGPISPNEARLANPIPDAVYEAFNELIVERDGIVYQDEVVERILLKMPELESDRSIYKKGWLNVEEAYREKGWDVTYDKPGYNETYRALFVFSKRRS